jgi:hypothetical protein
MENKEQQINQLFQMKCKSRSTAFVMATLLGPAGYLYASIPGGLVLLILTIVSWPTIFGPILFWFISILFAPLEVKRWNKKLLAEMNLKYG